MIFNWGLCPRCERSSHALMQLRKLLGERWARTQILRLKLQAQIAVATQVAKPLCDIAQAPALV